MKKEHLLELLQDVFKLKSPLFWLPATSTAEIPRGILEIL